MLFGDGAGAAVLTASADLPHASRIVAHQMRCFPSAYSASQIPAGGTRFDFHADPDAFARGALFEMDGRALFRMTAQHFAAFVDDLLAQAGWAREQVDLIIPHQASPQALAHMTRVAGFAADKVINITRHVGNQITASIPFALDHAVRQKRLRRGNKVLLLGTSAGVSIGGTELVY